MKTYKTWEMIKALTENPTLKFEAINTTGIYKFVQFIDGKLCWGDRKDLPLYITNKLEWELIQEPVERTRYTANEIIKYPDYAEIVLYDKNQNKKAKAKVDIDDIEKCEIYKWSYHNEGYVSNPTHNLMLHRLITDCPDELEVDHINHDKLDNRKQNLRVVTRSENNMNHRVRKDNSSGQQGVSWCNIKKRWRSRIFIGGKEVSLGYFEDLQDAIDARKDAEVEFYGANRYMGA